MTMITSVRAPLPVAEAPLAPRPEPRAQGSAASAVPATVAPALSQAVQQVPPRPPAADPHLLAARTTVETSAAEAAEAARAAYIKASIAAGISPLPLA
jgi:hypothetical protein